MAINPDNGFTLEETKEMQIGALKAVRDYKETQPVKYNNRLFDFDQRSYERITAAIYALSGGGTIRWTTADNTAVEITADDLKGIIAAAALRSNELHNTYRELKAAIGAAFTIADVLAIKWPND